MIAPYGMSMHVKWICNWIQYGHQAYVWVFHNWLKHDSKTILLSRKTSDLSTWNFCHLLVSMGECVLWNFAPIGNPIWPPGCPLCFFCSSTSRTIWAVNLNFNHRLVSVSGFVLPNFQPIRNPIWPPGRHLGFLLGSLPPEPFEQSIWNFNHWLVFIRGSVLSNFEPIGNPTWLPGRHLIFSFRCYISRTISVINLKFRP